MIGDPPEGEKAERQVHTPLVVTTPQNIDTDEVQKTICRINNSIGQCFSRRRLQHSRNGRISRPTQRLGCKQGADIRPADQLCVFKTGELSDELGAGVGDATCCMGCGLVCCTMPPLWFSAPQE